MICVVAVRGITFHELAMADFDLEALVDLEQTSVWQNVGGRFLTLH